MQAIRTVQKCLNLCIWMMSMGTTVVGVDSASYVTLQYFKMYVYISIQYEQKNPKTKQKTKRRIC